MSNKPSKEQQAHDLAIAYETICSIREDEYIDYCGFYANYRKAYDEFLDLITE